MKVKITYPSVSKEKMERRKIRDIARWPLLVAFIICPIINLATGGKAWSLVVLMSIYIVWTLVLSPDLVEYNRISQFVKSIILTSILLAIIDIFLVPGWILVGVVNSILGYCGLIVAGVLFFTDLETQKQNMYPLLFLIFYSMTISIIGLCTYHGVGAWTLAVMGGIALILLIAIIIVLGGYLLEELKKRFHTD